MDSSIIVALITGGVTLLGGAGWLFRNLLKNKDVQLERIRAERDATDKECEEERKRADAWQEKYVAVLIADIQERKDRDRTIELLTGAIRDNHKGNPKGREE